MSVARTAAGVEGALLIHADGTLVTSASMMFGEMRTFLLPPEDGRWLALDGSEVDTQAHPQLAGRIKTLPRIANTWVYIG